MSTPVEVLKVADVIDGHVVLDIRCLDRLYLNGYVPNLQCSGQVVSFMTAHLRNPIPSPAIMEKIGTRFRRAVERFAAAKQVPVIRFGKDDRKQTVMEPYLARQAATGVPGVAAIGVAQEYQNVWTGTRSKDRGSTGNYVWYSFAMMQRRVICYYFYIWEPVAFCGGRLSMAGRRVGVWMVPGLGKILLWRGRIDRSIVSRSSCWLPAWLTGWRRIIWSGL